MPQAVAHKNPVLANERNDVGDRRQRDEVEVFPEVDALHARGFEQGVCEFEDNTRAAEVVEIPAELGIHKRHAIGTLGGGFMVVEHHDIDPARAQARDFFHRGRPAIHGDQQAGIVEFQTAVHPGLAQAVALLGPQGQEARHLGAVGF